MSVNISKGYASALFDKEGNHQIWQRITQAINPEDINVSSLSKLSEIDKEWLYETDLVNTLENLKTQKNTNPQDTSSTLAELARFYLYKGREDLAIPLYKAKAKIDIENALRGDESILGIMNNMVSSKKLKDDFFQGLISRYQEGFHEFGKECYEDFIKQKESQNHVLALAETYKILGYETLSTRAQKAVPPIPLYDHVLKMDLEERFSKGKISH